MAASASPANADPLDPADGTVTAPCTPVADTTTVTVRGMMGSTAMQWAGGDGDGVAVLAVDVLVVVVIVAGAATAADEVAPDDVVLEEDVEVVVVAHHTGAGFDTEMVAFPAAAPWKLACIVPSEA